MQNFLTRKQEHQHHQESNKQLRTMIARRLFGSVCFSTDMKMVGFRADP